MKRVLSLFIAVVMVISMLPMASFAADSSVRAAAETVTVYLDPAAGADTNSGLTESAPVKTVAAAYAALTGAQAGKIVLLSTLTLTETTTFPTCQIPVTITGVGINSAKSIFFAGVTTLENITLTLNASNNTTYISSEGHDLTIGEGVVCKNSSTYRFCLTTRYGEGATNGATLTVKSGSWRSIFVAGYTKATTGGANLIMTGGSVNNMVAPSYSGNVTGNVTMQISGMTGGGAICCAPNQTGTVTGNVDITLGGNITGKLRIKRLHENATVNGTATVTIDGDCTGLTEIAHVGSGEGEITTTRLVLKSGALDLTPCTFDQVSVEIPQGKTFTLDGCRITANSVNSAGTLVFSGTASLAATAVTGSLNCQISGNVELNHGYVTAPATSNITFPASTGVKGNGGVWQSAGTFDAENFKGLVLYTTVDGITVELYKDFSTDAANLVTPVFIDGRYQYYSVKADDLFYGISKPTNANDKTRYELHQTFYISAAEANQKVEFDMTPGVRSTGGWETVEAVCRFTDEVMKKAFPSEAENWPQYQEIFTTPAFQPGRTEHRQTTQQEMEDFLKELDDPDDNIYVFSLGKTTMGSFDVPLVLVTSVKLPKDATLEQAAALIRADSEENNKVTVHYQAQIHGDEPAAGEGALGMIKRLDGEYGAGLVDNLNIYVLPRLNPYGAYKGKRITWIDSSTYLDPNRDFMNLRTSETQMRMKAFNLFEPEVVFDNHEYRFNLETKAITKRDMMICSHIQPIFSEEYKETAIGLAYAAFDQLEKDNLTYSWYSSDAQNYSISSVSSAVGSGNTAYRASMHILMETLGNNYGKNLYERRVASHVSAVTGILNHLDANAAKVRAVVKAQQNTIVENGKTYREDDVLAMTHQANYHPEYNIEGKKVNLRNGGEVDFTFEARMSDTVLRTRVAPTAYVIPAGESYIQRVLNLMDMQGIAYKFIPAGSAVMLQQYLGTVASDGTVSETTLTEDKLVAFPDGAYVFCMNQVDALILSCYMEPDYATTTETLTRQGIILPTDGAYPIYRYIHDLNDEGFIDYTTAPAAPAGLQAVGVTTMGGTGKITGLDASKSYEYRAAAATEYTPVAAGATEITGLALGEYFVRYPATAGTIASVDAIVSVGYALTEYAVYLDSASGSDTNAGYTTAAAVATIETAHTQLNALMQYAPAGTTGEIRIQGTYQITTTKSDYQLPKHTYPLLITGGTLVFTNTSTSAGKFMRINGDTTFDNITLQLGASGSSQFISGDGYKLVIGKNVISKPYSTSTYFGIQGGIGKYSQTATAARGDVTVLSGYWQTVYAGGYVSQVTGDVRAVVSGCSVKSVAAGHLGGVGGNAYIEVENMTARDELIAGTTGASKNIAGDMTLVLGENVTCPKIYATCDTGSVNGTVTVIADGIDLTANKINGKGNGTGSFNALVLDLRQGQLADAVDALVLKDGISVKLGCQQTKAVTLPYSINLDLNGYDIALSGSKAICKDSATDDYTVADGVYGTVAAGSNVEAADGYLAVTESGKTSFHKFEMSLTHLVVNTKKVGLTYKANFLGDEKIKAQVKEFGVAVRAFEAPTENGILADGEGAIHMALQQKDWNVGGANNLKSIYVTGILDARQSAQKNNERADIQVYGNCYVLWNDGTVLMGDEANHSLKSAMQYMDSEEIWNNHLTAADKADLAAFYETWMPVMQEWTEIDHIKALFDSTFSEDAES